ncbi:hypothetical protein B0H10DRAFT_1053877 [Mycena sp. CBHHK59/15]|nr:hypothetical protein B0H10DRAFT_1053877 [Mycena sp. CBHHK59/15]
MTSNQNGKVSHKQRKDDVLEALVVTAHFGQDTERLRRLCPETTLSFLAGGRGEGFLDLINNLMPKDLGNSIAEPIFVAHEGQRSEPIVVWPFCQCPRDSIWQELLSQSFNLYGIKEGRVKGKLPQTGDESSDDPFIQDLLGKKAARQFKKEWKAEKGEAVNICWGCGKSELPNVKSLACSRCRTIGQSIRYCSP